MPNVIHYDEDTRLDFVETFAGAWYWRLHVGVAVTECDVTFKTKQGALDDFKEVVEAGNKILRALPHIGVTP